MTNLNNIIISILTSFSIGLGYLIYKNQIEFNNKNNKINKINKNNIEYKKMYKKIYKKIIVLIETTRFLI